MGYSVVSFLRELAVKIQIDLFETASSQPSCLICDMHVTSHMGQADFFILKIGAQKLLGVFLNKCSKTRFLNQCSKTRSKNQCSKTHFFGQYISNFEINRNILNHFSFLLGNLEEMSKPQAHLYIFQFNSKEAKLCCTEKDHISGNSNKERVSQRFRTTT